ncbi:MAG: TPM domain-containing protein [Lachnospiraceae bacterium]|nr:TPM domain-containing protein [Lachnospiraceae bacterium]
MTRQKRKLFSGLLFVLTAWMMLCTGMTASAANTQKIVDMADLLEEEEEEKLQKQLSGIAEKYQCDVAVVTTDSCGGKSPQDYTDDYYEENGYGYGADYDGIMLMVSMGERKFHLATQGKAIDIFTGYGLQKIDDLISGKLSDGKYYAAFKKFGDLTEEFILEAEKGTPFDVRHEYKERMGIGPRLLIALAAGLLVAGTVLFVLLRQLKSVGIEKTAQEYVREGSFRVTRQRDIFLYRTVSKMKKEKPESGGGGGGGSMTHTTSGGRNAGGHTGSF